MSKARLVQAFLIEMSTLPIHAPSIRTCATRLPPASATAMFIGWPISWAFFSAAAITRRASFNVIMRFLLQEGKLEARSWKLEVGGREFCRRQEPRRAPDVRGLLVGVGE